MNNGFLGFTPSINKSVVRAAQTTTHNLATIPGIRVNFDNIILDNERCIVPGASIWRFNVPRNGVYSVWWQVGINAGTELFCTFYVDNAQQEPVTYHQGSSGTWNSIKGAWFGYLYTGNYFYVHGITASGTPATIAVWTGIQVLFIG
jgi:hypothetical protein